MQNFTFAYTCCRNGKFSILAVRRPKLFNKNFKVFVQVIDKAKEGCWTNISETRKYIKNKLSESGAKLIDDQARQI